MAPMPHSKTCTADTGAEATGESQPPFGWPRRTRPCFSLPKAHASVDGHESGSNGTSRVATAKESGRELWQWGCWGRYGLIADLRRWGKLPARRGTLLAVLFMLHGRRTYELIFLHGYITVDLPIADYLILCVLGLQALQCAKGLSRKQKSRRYTTRASALLMSQNASFPSTSTLLFSTREQARSLTQLSQSTCTRRTRQAMVW